METLETLLIAFAGAIIVPAFFLLLCGAFDPGFTGQMVRAIIHLMTGAT